MSSLFKRLVRHFLDIAGVEVVRQDANKYPSLRNDQFARDCVATQNKHQERLRAADAAHLQRMRVSELARRPREGHGAKLKFPISDHLR
jgi:hypothetical protein